ncbi:hypothetical protein SAMN05444359_11793 [Neolewinella agarilytica]|uniref:Uncharacterized protein n=1 Tax=Neolewinella agarilytica TaxID=478744 RepID=A0A1H9JIT8_9BACT|nr:hypothetical protein SAMN05444359_11793 [Neolewinella agarilytica]
MSDELASAYAGIRLCKVCITRGAVNKHSSFTILLAQPAAGPQL